MKEKNKNTNMKKEDYLQMIVVGLREHCTSWNYDWLDKLKEECTVKTFFKLFTKVTKTYFFKWESSYYNVEFLKDERVVIKKCGPDFGKREIDIELSLPEVLDALNK